ncbi:MAG: AGE family epimerase/isomerase [Planctomycetota bacterium]
MKQIEGDFLREMEEELSALLSWWMENMVYNQNGGFYGRMDGRGKLYPDADKGVILNTRILWTFAAAARATDSELYASMARRAYEYITQYFLDPVDGGVFWMLDVAGQPVLTKKQIYAQAFAIYAFSEYYLLTEDETALKQANAIFHLVEAHSADKVEGGYLEAFGRNWQLLDDLRLSTKDANEAKTMNTHLHILEAYTNLFRASREDKVGHKLKELILCFLDKFIDHSTGHLKLFFDERWQLKSNEISFGHDIECSWLLVEAAELLGDSRLLQRVVAPSMQMARAVLNSGTDEDGAIFNELKESILDSDKHWWPQAEAVVGFWNAWELTGEEAFKSAALSCWSSIKNKIKDQNLGEWHWCTDRAGIPRLSEDQAGPWKARHPGQRGERLSARPVQGLPPSRRRDRSL